MFGEVFKVAKAANKLRNAIANHENTDGSSRRSAIRKLRDYEELRICKEPQDRFDPNANLTATHSGMVLGHLNKRLAGEVTRNLNRGVHWRCYVRTYFIQSDQKTEVL